MRHLGLDFGTTTSILSVHDGTKLNTFKLGGAAATPYIPSVLSLDTTDDTVEIGHAARLNQGDDDYQVFSHFKMLLAENRDKVLQARGYSDHTPADITQRFLQALLDSYQREAGGDVAIANIVITVPEIWVRSGQHAAREVLEHVCQQLALPQVKLLSEPVAAAVYFADCYRAKHNTPFQGHILVCDYGGGTLDLSLSVLQEERITVLEGTGKGVVQDSMGTAGVAFDEAVVEHVLRKHNAEVSPRQRYQLLKAFEEQKIAQTDKLSKLLERYLRNPATNKKVFQINEFTVEVADLVTTFDQLIAPELDHALTEMASYFAQHQVDTQHADQFHVVMVGGFSNFYLVRQRVRQFFESKTSADRRFQTYFDLTDTALAIAKGAGLVAKGTVQVEQVCPISVGIRAKDRTLEDTDLLLLTKGTPLKDYQQAQFTPMWLSVMSEKALQTTSLKLFLDVGNGKRRYIDLQGKLQDFIPNPNVDNQWRVGFSVDDNLLFNLNVEDKNGAHKITPLGNLVEKMSGLHIADEM